MAFVMAVSVEGGDKSLIGADSRRNGSRATRASSIIAPPRDFFCEGDRETGW